MKYPHQLTTTIRCPNNVPDTATLTVWRPGTADAEPWKNHDIILNANFERSHPKLGWRITAVHYNAAQAGFAVADLQNHYTDPFNIIRALLTAILDSIR